MIVRKYRIKTLSPLHISGKETGLLPFEFVFFKGKVYVLSEDKLAERLGSKLLNLLIDEIRIKGRDFNIREFLTRYNLLSVDFLERCKIYTVSAHRPPSPYLKPYIKDAFYQPYIPGSSIKGALRTSLIYNILASIPKDKKEKLLDDFARKKLEDFQRDRRKDRGRFRKKSFADNLEKEILKKFVLSDSQKKFGPHTDIMRAIKISDTAPLSLENLRVDEIKIYTINKKEPKNFTIFAETLLPDTETDFTISFDEELFTHFEKMSKESFSEISFDMFRDFFNDPFRISKKMASDYVDYENKSLPDFGLSLNFEKKPNLRIGFGSGLLGVTVDLLLSEEMRKELRNLLNPRHRRNEVSPKSRKIDETEHRTGLGWCNVHRMD